MLTGICKLVVTSAGYKALYHTVQYWLYLYNKNTAITVSPLCKTSMDYDNQLAILPPEMEMENLERNV